MLLNCCTLKIPVRNFGDVIDHGYKVIVYSSYYTKKLAMSPPGTPKHQVYKEYVEKQPPMQGNPRQAGNAAKGRIYISDKSVEFESRIGLSHRK